MILGNYTDDNSIPIISLFSQQWEGVGERQRNKNEYIYLKRKKENNIKTMVLKIYL